SVAEKLGIRISEVKSTEPIDYAELLNVRVFAEGKEVSVSGTFYGSVNNPRIVRINNMPVEAVPHGVLCIMSNTDRPGIVGRVGTILGKHHVNIASMTLGREHAGGQALTVLNLDSSPDAKVVAELKADSYIYDVKVV